ncbi:MAG: hypothetical protein HQK60_18005 [Deltaproteobacteria bacterium]|nr:hypothetical protein [Deltaproteobacteria bacterium]
MIELSGILNSLRIKRCIFHSEADFQHTLAWEIHLLLPDASIRLEFPFKINNENKHIDIWVVNHDEILAVELKYKTQKLSTQVRNEQYELKNQRGHTNLTKYFKEDIQRLEHISTNQMKFIGYAVLLTNDSTYWNSSSRNGIDPTRLGHKYHVNWEDFSQLDSDRSYSLFRSLTIKVAHDQ